MSKRSLAGLALWLYPCEVRETRGQEILGTLLDAGEASVTDFVRQLCSVIIGGLLARSRVALGEPAGRLTANAVCWAAVIAVVRVPFGPGVDLFRAPIAIPPITVLDTWVVPLAVLVLFTVGGRRTTGLIGLAWVAFFVKEHPQVFGGFLTFEVSQILVLPVLGFGLMSVWPQATPRSSRALWLLPATAWGLMHLTLVVLLGSGMQMMLIPILTGLLFLPFAPAFALGNAIVWSAPYITMPTHSPGTLMVFAGAPVALLLFAAARHATRRA